MRAVCPIFLLTAAFVFAGQPTTPQPLTAPDSAALQEPLALGHRVLGALFRYLDIPRPRIPAGRDLLTEIPTIEILHAVGYLTDSDIALSAQYHATLHPIPAGSPPIQPALTMTSERGELIFDISGSVALELHK